MIQSFLDYLLLEKKYSKNTIIAYSKDLHLFFDYIENEKREFSQVTSKDIRNYLSNLVEQKLEATSIRRKLSSVKSFYAFLVQIDEVLQNPAEGLTSPKIKENVIHPFTIKEMEKLFETPDLFTSDEQGDSDRLILMMFYFTGIRREELIQLKWSSFSVNMDTLKVVGKRDKQRIIPIHSYLKEHVIQFKENHRKQDTVQSFVFQNSKGLKLNPKIVYEKVNMYLSAVSTKKKISPHMLRHTFASQLLQQGAEINSIKELLGHSSLAATQVYVHTDIQALKKVYKQAHPRAKK